MRLQPVISYLVLGLVRSCDLRPGPFLFSEGRDSFGLFSEKLLQGFPDLLGVIQNRPSDFVIRDDFAITPISERANWLIQISCHFGFCLQSHGKNWLDVDVK